jgi:hypothetical protein
MVSEILKKTKSALGSRSAVQKRAAFPENFPAKPLLDQNRTGISGFRCAPGPEIRSSAARRKEFRDPGTILNLPHLNTSGNTHGESIMIDLAQA